MTPVGKTTTAIVLEHVETRPCSEWFSAKEIAFKTGEEYKSVYAALQTWTRDGFLLRDEQDPPLYSRLRDAASPKVRHNRFASKEGEEPTLDALLQEIQRRFRPLTEYSTKELLDELQRRA